ncbi:MAG: hypothetical protein ABW133_05880 [Polyangiaceae bacterium]
MVRIVEADLAETARSDPNAGVSVARFSHRLFDARWLRSPAARFELVGVVNRLDRAGIIGGCGEVRLVYRLAYTTEHDGRALTSRLPMTVSVELSTFVEARDLREGSGRARRWRLRRALRSWRSRLCRLDMRQRIALRSL